MEVSGGRPRANHRPGDWWWGGGNRREGMQPGDPAERRGRDRVRVIIRPIERFTLPCSVFAYTIPEDSTEYQESTARLASRTLGMVAYSIDLRERVIAAVGAGEETQEQIARRFTVSSR